MSSISYTVAALFLVAVATAARAQIDSPPALQGESSSDLWLVPGVTERGVLVLSSRATRRTPPSASAWKSSARPAAPGSGGRA